jgi:hypothetical protein
MLFFPDCFKVIRGTSRLVAGAPRHVIGTPRLVASAPRCFQTYHNLSHCTPVPVIRDPSYSEGRSECPPLVWRSPAIVTFMFTLHILSDTPGGIQRHNTLCWYSITLAFALKYYINNTINLCNTAVRKSQFSLAIESSAKCILVTGSFRESRWVVGPESHSGQIPEGTELMQ